MSDFVHLHVRSGFSLHFGPRDVVDLVKAAVNMGYDTMALTDIDCFYGVNALAEACKEEGSKATEKIQPIFGMEISGIDGQRAVLLARDKEGFSNICRLATLRKRGTTPDLGPLIPSYAAGLAVMSDDTGLLRQWHKSVENLYAIVTPWSRHALPLAQRLSIPPVASCEATFLNAEDREVQRVLRAIGTLRPLAAVADTELTPVAARLYAPDVAASFFADIPEAVANTRRIADSVTFHTTGHGFVFPQWGTQDAASKAAHLRARVYEGARRLYGEPRPEVEQRIEHELSIIIDMNFTDYFLVVADIVNRTSRTCGRGSGAASIVAYCLRITNVDPIAGKLYFERFLNRGRKDMPDIDVDFAWDERDEIIKSVIADYGPERSARVANHVRFRARSAIREIARVYGLPEHEISGFERELRHAAPDNPAPDPPSAGEHGSPKNKVDGADAVWKEILSMAQRLEGLPRGLSVHSGGIVLTPGPIDSYAPIEEAPSATILGWEKDGTEAAGLVKIDLLGNRSLAVIRDALAMLAREGRSPETDTWNPLRDPQTEKLLASGNSIGVFYTESPAMRQLQAKTHKGDFETIVMHSSIIRPAANRFINEYVERLKGKKWEHLDPRFADFLGETYGIMCYQEDISRAAMAMAGFNEADADKLRKAVSKKPWGRTLREFKEMFFDGARRSGTKEEVIAATWDMIMSFDGYSFCKPHSASYAMVSFQSAYLKAHHGPQFMAAVLSNEGGFYTAQAYISETRRMRIPIDGPDVNASAVKYEGRGQRLRIGLMAVKGLSRDTAEKIVAERERNGTFTSLADFARRVAVARDEASALAMAGAMDTLYNPDFPRGNRYQSLRGFIKASTRSSIRYPAGKRAPAELALTEGAAAEKPSATSPLGSYAASRPLRSRAELQAEFEILGYLTERHPTVLWKEEIASRSRVFGRDMAGHVGHRVMLLGWPITRKQVATKDGDAMEFFSFEDETAIYETVLFPRVYARYARLLYELKPYWVYGRVDCDHGAVCLSVERVEALAGGLRSPGLEAREIPGFYGYGTSVHAGTK